jgi:hypothetical protein
MLSPNLSGGPHLGRATSVQFTLMDAIIALDALLKSKEQSIRTQIAELNELKTRREQIRAINASVAA